MTKEKQSPSIQKPTSETVTENNDEDKEKNEKKKDKNEIKSDPK